MGWSRRRGDRGCWHGRGLPRRHSDEQTRMHRRLACGQASRHGEPKDPVAVRVVHRPVGRGGAHGSPDDARVPADAFLARCSMPGRSSSRRRERTGSSLRTDEARCGLLLAGRPVLEGIGVNASLDSDPERPASGIRTASSWNTSIWRPARARLPGNRLGGPRLRARAAAGPPAVSRAGPRAPLRSIRGGPAAGRPVSAVPNCTTRFSTCLAILTSALR